MSVNAPSKTEVCHNSGFAREELAFGFAHCSIETVARRVVAKSLHRSSDTARSAAPPPRILREKIVTLFPSAAGQCWIDKYARSLRRLCVVLGAGEEDRGRGGGALSSRFCLWTIRSLENVSHVSYGGESGRGSEVFAGEKKESEHELSRFGDGGDKPKVGEREKQK